jgi:uncharacterized protein (TIGR02996 family)
MWPDCASDPTGLALLQGAKEHALDTDRRLILADWLEEQDEAAVASCLRASLQKREDWVPLPESVAARWRPWNGCVNGWLGLRKVLADWPDSPWLCALDLARTRLDNAGAPALAVTHQLRHLTTLNLKRNYIGLAGVQALATSLHLAQLTSLDLRNNEIDPAGAQALAGSPGLCQLTELNLGDNQIGDAGVQALANSPYLRQLTILNLEYNEIGPAGVQALAGSANLAQLTDLNLRVNAIGDLGVQALANSTTLPRLTRLYLFSAFDSTGMAAVERLQARGVVVNF